MIVEIYKKNQKHIFFDTSGWIRSEKKLGFKNVNNEKDYINIQLYKAFTIYINKKISKELEIL